MSSGKDLEKVICEIPLKLPSLNDYVKVCRSNQFMAGSYVKKIEKEIGQYLKDLPHFENRISIDFHWVEENRKRDPDNIASAKKFILDAMQKEGIIKNDNWKCINTEIGFHDTWSVGTESKVILTITESEGE